MQMTSDEKARIHLALERSNGNRKIAAVGLGMTTNQLKDKIHSSPELRERWANSTENPPVTDSIKALSRPTPEPEMIPTQEQVAVQIAQAMEMDAKVIGEDLGRLNLPKGAEEIAIELFRWNKKHFFDALHLTAGGAQRQQIVMQHYMDRSWLRLDEVRALIATTVTENENGHKIIDRELREILVREEKGLLDSQATLLSVMDRMFKTSFDAAEIVAGVWDKMKGGKRKPGFTEEPKK